MLCSRLLLIILVFTPFFALAHTDISETIKALTTRIEAKPTADLYYQRGTEFRALQQKAHAIEDLESALKIEPHNRHALVALVQLYETNTRAKALISRYQKFAKTKEEKFEAHYLLASYNAKLGLFEQASSQCDTLHLIRPSEDPALDLFHGTATGEGIFADALETEAFGRRLVRRDAGSWTLDLHGLSTGAAQQAAVAAGEVGGWASL